MPYVIDDSDRDDLEGLLQSIEDEGWMVEEYWTDNDMGMQRVEITLIKSE